MEHTMAVASEVQVANGQITLSQEQLAQLVAAELAKAQAHGKNRTIIKLTDKGGLFVRHASFVELSREGKEYLAGVNLPLKTAKALFTNDKLLSEIRAFLGASCPPAIPADTPPCDPKPTNTEFEPVRIHKDLTPAEMQEATERADVLYVQMVSELDDLLGQRILKAVAVSDVESTATAAAVVMALRTILHTAEPKLLQCTAETN
jgi:hypothetical protein